MYNCFREFNIYISLCFSYDKDIYYMFYQMHLKKKLKTKSHIHISEKMPIGRESEVGYYNMYSNYCMLM